MSRADIVGLFVFLAIFVFAPVVLALCCFNRGSKPTHQECPHCGAHNHKAKEHCYCCGHRFVRPGSEAVAVTVIQRVKQAEDSKVRRETEAFSPRKGAEKTSG
jgi:hypothetical protein